MMKYINFIEYVNGKTIEKKRLDKIGAYTIFSVNAAAIRDTSQADDEFNDFGTHLEFPKIVQNKEIWVSNDVSERERQFLIHNALHQYKREGKKDWYEYALKSEKAEREKVDGIKFKGKFKHEKPPEKVYSKYYCVIPSEDDDIEVWLIDVEIVQDLYKTDFVLGGNGGKGVYHFIPSNEIWIDKDLAKDGEDEIPLVILHEYIENTLMTCNNMSYNKAHSVASKVEFHHRNKKWDITDVKVLNREEALKMAEKYLNKK